MKVGAIYQGEGRCEFVVWAPLKKQVSVQIFTPTERTIPLELDPSGHWRAVATDIQPGTRYSYQLDGDLVRPDPASNFQPEDVHKPSAVVDHNDFQWQDQNWQGIPLEDWVVYELHIGTFTTAGTFTAIIERIPDLLSLGVNVIELMPVAQFPGNRNWGYDGVYPYGVQASYGGPDGLKQLVNACHQQGMAVVMDVVYNHLGPEGNYTQEFGPYFTDRYNTPWGRALNFDDAHSPGVRNFFIENALYWLRDYHIDGLRLDAVHAIYDFGARHILEEMADRVLALSHQVGRQFYLIAESDLNDVRVIRSRDEGGHGIDAQRSDDFHHCIHTVLTGENSGYYQDFGQVGNLAKAIQEGFVYSWNYSPDRKRYHGNYAGDRPPSQFVVCSQNHDQVGNRMLGERLTHLVSFDALKLAAATVILSPYIPMLFMGEEYGEDSPFLYFISHSDPGLVEAVRQGRKREFEAFHAVGEPPDAQCGATFQTCVLKWEQRNEGKHQVLWNWYQTLIQLRRQTPALKQVQRQCQTVNCSEDQKVLAVHQWCDNSEIFYAINFNQQPQTVEAFPIKQASGQTWQKRLDSTEPKWMGLGSQVPETLEPSQAFNLPPQSVIVCQV
ncbi:MAG: malto-oligosyltrehalose trehalohydrolase [Microcoleaceae cyanobacterium]